MPYNLQEQFNESARSFSDKQLINTIEQSYDFPIEKVKAAKTVALERGLFTEAQLGQFTGKAGLIRNAKSMLEGGRSVDDILRNLISRGSTEDEATLAIHEASKVADMNRKSVVEDSDYSSKLVWIFAGIIILKIIRSIMNNN